MNKFTCACCCMTWSLARMAGLDAARKRQKLLRLDWVSASALAGPILFRLRVCLAKHTFILFFFF